MTPRGRKAKGRTFQQAVRDCLLGLLPSGEFQSTFMSQPGTDIIDPRKLLPWPYTECRHWETWPKLEAIVEEMKKANSPLWAYTIKKNRQQPVWVVPQAAMLLLLDAWLKRQLALKGLTE